VKHELVAMSVRVRPLDARLKLRGIVVESPGKSESYVFSFFHNAILRSKAIPTVVAGDAVEHLVLLDLPPGAYALKSVEFAPLGDAPAQTSVMRHVLAKPVRFHVAEESVIYIGRLLLDIGATRVTDVVVRQSPVSVAPDVEKLAGEVTVGIAAAEDEDLPLLRHRYPALARQDIAVRAMTIGP
jgi:hypothetical protein